MASKFAHNKTMFFLFDLSLLYVKEQPRISIISKTRKAEDSDTQLFLFW